jgi:hypothetical protein
MEDIDPIFDDTPLEDPDNCPKWKEIKATGVEVFITMTPNKYKNVTPHPSNPKIMTPQQFLEEYAEELSKPKKGEE